MEAAFWQGRWKEGRIGFHEGRPNAMLQKFAAELGSHRRVLVPLCGKSEDLAFLAASGHSVVGVELVESATKAFFDEHHIHPVVTDENQFKRYRHGEVSILVGDFFALTPTIAGELSALFDRAALIALPLEMRTRYVKALRELISPKSTGLVVTLEYPPDSMNGPPFSVSEAELRQHYTGLQVDRLDEAAAEGPTFTAIGAKDVCWKVQF